jgi:arylsulfatase A-like enzyme
MAGVDDGVGRILETLARRQLDQTTLIFFASDNGAPLQGKKELPVEVGGATWDGSLNDPWVGEKGMLTEGGIRVPYLIRWRGALSPGIYDLPVSTLDIAATALAAAGLPHDPVLDGVDLVPFLTGVRPGDPHDALYWRFWTQSAIRSGRWKYLRAGDRAEYLFDLESETHERTNRLESHPRVAAELRGRLEIWAKGLHEPGVPSGDLRRGEDEWYATHLGLPKTVSNARPRQKDDASH